MRKVQANWKGLLLLMIFSYVMALSYAVQGGSWESFSFKVDAPWWIFLQGLLIIQCIRWARGFVGPYQPAYNRIGTYYARLWAGSLLLFLSVKKSLSLVVALAFGNMARNFNTYTLLFSTLDDLLLFSLVGNAYLLWRYVQDNHALQQRALAAEKIAIQHQYQSLKKQLDPHFLFNNLNVLSQLIGEDSHRADRFLHKLSDLYRYTLQHQTGDLVRLADELTIAQHYLFLINERFDNGYQLILPPVPGLTDRYVPCFSVQNLVENAVKHNVGTPETPLLITICCTPDSVTVENQRRPRKSESGGIGLQNLQKQYAILSNRTIKIEQTETYFRVILPLLTVADDERSADRR
ncbi:sensor histidine kinase [Rudanella lutea]|uniref:sensor histidine kinase n=1 Tax=Rudanella lutea TaxID=451374 RepID=UPI0003605590|nr:histidine kinase [Rudanella lutea]